MGRKKLVGRSIAVVALVLGVLWMPSAAMGQNGDDGCMRGVVEEQGWFVRFAVNACIVIFIGTVTAMWVYDYKNRIQKGN